MTTGILGNSSRNLPRMLLSGSFAALIWANPVLAQTTSSSPPAEKFVISPGGVDMRTGRYGYDKTDLSIGESNESGGLTLSRTLSTAVPGHQDPFGNFSHNWDIYMTESAVDLNNGNYQHGAANPDQRMSIRYGARSDTFESPATLPGFYQESRAGRALLTYTGDKYTGIYKYEASDGTQVTFRPLSATECSTFQRCAFASNIILPDGTRFDLAYDTGTIPRLRRVSSSRGYVLLFEYGTGGTVNNVTKACILSRATLNDPTSYACPGNALATTSYTYTTFNSKTKLATAVDAVGGTYNFTYTASGSNFLMTFKKPGQASPWLTNTVEPVVNAENGEDERIISQAFADGSSYAYSYTPLPFIDNQPPSIAGGTYTNAQSGITQVIFGFFERPAQFTYSPTPRNYGAIDYQVTPGPIEVIDPDGKSWKSSYCDVQAAGSLPGGPLANCLVSTLQWTEDPELNKTEYTIPWTTRNVNQVKRKAKPGSLDGDITTSATYNCLNAKICAKPQTTTDAKGQVTTYTYDANHGGVLTETLPAVGGITPQKRYEYAQRYSWIKDSAGTFVQSAAPMWVLVRARFCKTTNPSGSTCGGGASDEVVTDYDYGPNSGPNTLLLRGMVVTATNSNGTLESQRTCYGYDDFGRRISETKPLANLTACP